MRSYVQETSTNGKCSRIIYLHTLRHSQNSCKFRVAIISKYKVDAAKVANTLLEYCRDHLQAILEVMEDYFNSPDKGKDSDSDKDDFPNLRN